MTNRLKVIEYASGPEPLQGGRDILRVDHRERRFNAGSTPE